MNDLGKNKNRKNLRNASIDRFIWRKGGVEIVHDPYVEKRNERNQESSRSQTEEPRELGSE